MNKVNTDTIAYLCEAAFQNSNKHGFWSAPRNRGEMIALMHSELSEALEGIRKDLMDDHLPQYKMEHVELADASIRIFDYCGGFEIPLQEIIKAKMIYNASRPYKHGKNF